MYVVDGDDRVVRAEHFPQSDAGAPLPFLVADESRLLLGYLAHSAAPGSDGSPGPVAHDETEDLVAIVDFRSPLAHYLGMPNDEAFEGHPLAHRGLEPYGAYIVENSSWIRRLEEINSVHRRHRTGAYSALTHFVFAFHDSTFECVAGTASSSLHVGPLRAAAKKMLRRLP